jgi:hypothetical protein
MDDQAQVAPVAAMAKCGCTFVDYGSICPSGGHRFGDGLDAFDAPDGPNTNPVIHGNYD